MKQKLPFILSTLIVFGIFGFSCGILQKSPLTYSIPDTKEAKEIMKMVEKAYDLEVEASNTFDLKKFPTVFINAPRFPVSPSTLQVVREMTNSPTLDSAGYLDYKLAYYTWRANAILHSEDVHKKAKAENRALNNEEIQSLTDKYGRIAPTRFEGIRTTRKTPLRFISMEIGEDIAFVVIDDGPRTVELTVVLVDNHWYIAGIKGISIHP